MSRTNRNDTFKKKPKAYVAPAKDRQSARLEILEEWDEWEEDTETSSEGKPSTYKTEEPMHRDGNET